MQHYIVWSSFFSVLLISTLQCKVKLNSVFYSFRSSCHTSRHSYCCVNNQHLQRTNTKIIQINITATIDTCDTLQEEQLVTHFSFIFTLRYSHYTSRNQHLIRWQAEEQLWASTVRYERTDALNDQNIDLSTNITHYKLRLKTEKPKMLYLNNTQ